MLISLLACASRDFFLLFGLRELVVLRLKLLYLFLHLGDERLLLLSDQFTLLEALGKLFQLVRHLVYAKVAFSVGYSC